MSSYSDMLAAVLADPEDNKWRLQFADWLDEHVIRDTVEARMATHQDVELAATNHNRV